MKLRNDASPPRKASPEESRPGADQAGRRGQDVLSARRSHPSSRRRQALTSKSKGTPWFAARGRAIANARIFTASGEREAVAFLLAPHQGGLYVECGRLQETSRAIVAMRFADGESFRRWCEADRLQFTYPLLYANLKRSGCELFDNA